MPRRWVQLHGAVHGAKADGGLADLPWSLPGEARVHPVGKVPHAGVAAAARMQVRDV